MTILTIPTQAIPNQSLNVVANQQNCTINLWTRGINNYLYFDLLLNNSPIILGRQVTLSGILPYKYMQALFNGNFAILNADGNVITNPIYTLLSTTQRLIYYTEDELQ